MSVQTTARFSGHILCDFRGPEARLYCDVCARGSNVDTTEPLAFLTLSNRFMAEHGDCRQANVSA